jgi:uncharacterized YccA/Bax inhibitor family protein
MRCNRCHGNAANGILGLMSSIYALLGNHLLLKDVGPYGITFTMRVKTVALVLLLWDFRPY